MIRAAAALLVLALLVPGCGEKEPPPDAATSGKTVVTTTFYPTTYFAERLGGDLVEVVCPLPEGADPIFWKPDEDTVRRVQRADLIVVNGAHFEKWVERTTLPPSRLVDTAKPFEAEWIAFEEAVTHRHGPSGEHAHEGIDGHTWLDPNLAKIQAGEIAKALTRRRPDHADAIAERLRALEADLDALDARFREVSDGAGDRTVLASHPAYNYLTKRYAWSVVNLDLDPETMPDEEALASVRETAQRTGARHLLWESEPTEAIAARFRDLGLESVLVSPCETGPVGGDDYLAAMHANLDRLTPVLSPDRD